MVPQNAEAGRGRHLAPAPEVVSADTPEHSPALITKQANWSAERFELHDRGYGTWITLALPVNKTIAALAEIIQDRGIESRPTITTADAEVGL